MTSGCEVFENGIAKLVTRIREKDLKNIFPEKTWNKLHLQIIWYGRKFSPARGWNLNNDPITKKIGRKSVINFLKN